MSELPLIVKNLTFRYSRRPEPAIENISFSIRPGQVMLIAGSSGCGKTTLMRCINGLIPHTYHGEMSGDIRLFGKSVKVCNWLRFPRGRHVAAGPRTPDPRQLRFE